MFTETFLHLFTCDCKDDTFYIGLTNKYQISGIAQLKYCYRDHNYDNNNVDRSYDPDMRCIILCGNDIPPQHIVFNWNQNETIIDDLVKLFNQQIFEQLEEQYDLGGKKFIEAGKEIEKLLG